MPEPYTEEELREHNSNTTLVKVKYEEWRNDVMVGDLFKYNSC